MHLDLLQVTGQDELLLQSVEQYGRNWKKIVDNNFTGRTAISAKNRYSILTRKLRDQGSRSSSRRPSKSSVRKSCVTMSQEPASSKQADTDDETNDIDADASTDDDMAQFLKVNQAADNVLGEASIYSRTGSESNFPKKNYDPPSLQRPAYSTVLSSHDSFGKSQP